MSGHSLNSEPPTVKIDYSERVTSQSPVPTSSGNVFTSFIKKVPYNQLSPALKRRPNPKKDGNPGNADPENVNKRSAVSQIFHSVPGAVKKKFSRGAGAPSPELGSEDASPEFEEQHQRQGDFRNVLEQINSADTPLLKPQLDGALDATQITMIPNNPGPFQVDSDDENTDMDGMFTSLFSQLHSTSEIDIEIIKIKSEIEITQRNSTELTKRYLEVSKTVSDTQLGQLPDLATREQYNMKNLKAQRHVRDLQNQLKKLEKRQKEIRDQEESTAASTEHPGDGTDTVERQRTPEHGGKIGRVIHRAVANRKKNKKGPGPEDKNWGSDGAIDQSSGVVELTEAITESLSATSRDLEGDHMTVPPVEYSSVVSDHEEEGEANNEDIDNLSDRVDSTSNLGQSSASVINENIVKLREDYQTLIKEVQQLRETYKEGILLVNRNLEKQHDYFVDALQDVDRRILQIDRVVDDKLYQSRYSSDERVKEIEERLDDYKYKMARFEELQEQRRMENPLSGNDIASRGRDVMSSIISLGLAMVSLLLFVFTTALDFMKAFSENNAVSTVLSLGLFGLIIALYHYFDCGDSSTSITDS